MNAAYNRETLSINYEHNAHCQIERDAHRIKLAYSEYLIVSTSSVYIDINLNKFVTCSCIREEFVNRKQLSVYKVYNDQIYSHTYCYVL